MTIVGSTCQAYGDEPSVTRMFGKNGTEPKVAIGAASGGGGCVVAEAGGTETTTAITSVNARRPAARPNPRDPSTTMERRHDNRFLLRRVAAKD